MIFKRIPVGLYAANCYIIGCENTKEGIIVDPGADAKTILAEINALGLDIKYIVLTHGHGDHIGALEDVHNELDVPILIHGEDEYMLKNSSENFTGVMNNKKVEMTPHKTLKDGDIIEFGNMKAEVIHTPGHTKGGICLSIEDILLTGDTLFAGSIGRTDFPGGSFEEIIKSIKTKLLKFDDNIRVYPGHGPHSTIGAERVSNPFIN
ncbi:MBL fold metallo-hydrolase [Clostridiisalibacter paucivorans]|uniref:MBL fold metallo-hydrolase n=1 Tax=Clostridiisalibacter paucivorans TaxID=408753 RepID=UPI00047C8C15|nr:MBL fold metallo-hydrolase [Clostridiisalibacter paucivorans]